MPGQPNPTPADALAAKGTPFPLADGGIVRMRYSLDSLKALEQKFGSIPGLQKAFERVMSSLSEDAPERKPDDMGAIEALIVFLAAGLRHVWVNHPDTDERIRLGHDVDLVGEQLDLSNLHLYVKAFSSAFGQAMGPQSAAGKAAGPAARRSTGRGSTGGTSPSTSLTSAPSTSGT